ncbi:MAG: GIY-YIG nuclease family protein [Sphingopyxis sp.]
MRHKRWKQPKPVRPELVEGPFFLHLRPMSFWAYMLHCRGGMFYIGHTDNLPHRIGQHEAGSFPGFTADRLPVTLVWSQEFPTRYEALEAERRIKGWSRIKKMALIRGDWHQISTLAKSKNGPSTSSGRTEKKAAMSHTPATVCPELVEGLSLSCHPETPCDAVRRITASAARNEWGQLVLRFHVVGDLHRLSIPGPVAYARRSDGLWQTTCVEAFAKPVASSAYAEFNFAPSSAWAAYEFEAYRQPIAPPPLDAPPIDVELADGEMIISAAVDMSPLTRLSARKPWQIGLSAVIEEVDGTKSYWALAHPSGKPDFHHPDCFALTLGAPPAA